MDLELSEKIAFISGSSRGIGLEIAKTLNKEGCTVIINGRNQKSLDNALEELPNATSICADITSHKESKKVISELIDKFGRLDILVCNVGNGSSAKPGTEEYKDWERSFSENFWSVTNLVEASRKNLSETKGSIVCVSSICGNELITGAPLTYSAAKAALNSYVNGASRPLGEMGIRINAVAPGNILFNGSVWDQKITENKKEVEEFLKKEVPLKKLGSTKDISNLVAYLASPISSFVTGSVWTADGGQTRS